MSARISTVFLFGVPFFRPEPGVRGAPFGCGGGSFLGMIGGSCSHSEESPSQAANGLLAAPSSAMSQSPTLHVERGYESARTIRATQIGRISRPFSVWSRTTVIATPRRSSTVRLNTGQGQRSSAVRFLRNGQPGGSIISADSKRPHAFDARNKLGPYEIVGPLGAGGMGEVYRARDTRLDRDVAIKVLPTAYRRDPERSRASSARRGAVASLNHPHIAAIYDIANDRWSPVYRLELVEAGGS